MKLHQAIFFYEHPRLGSITVTWADEEGKSTVTIQVNGRENVEPQLLSIDNEKKLYRPCVTHALDLIKRKLCQQPRSNQARQREKETRPKLRVVASRPRRKQKPRDPRWLRRQQRRGPA